MSVKAAHKMLVKLTHGVVYVEMKTFKKILHVGDTKNYFIHTTVRANQRRNIYIECMLCNR